MGGFVISDNLKPLVSSLYRNDVQYSSDVPLVGKVFGVITTYDTPNKELFISGGALNGIGTIYYKIYDDTVKDLEPGKVDNEFLKTCLPALPIFPHMQDYPLLGEIVLLIKGPSYSGQENKLSSQLYYLCASNLFNSNEHNTPGYGKLGDTFEDDTSVKSLIAFEGDRIYRGRKENSLRFSSTVKLLSNLNEWSKIGKNGDPITTLVNGYAINQPNPTVEKINEDKSSLYLTSTQSIPLKPGSSIVNPQLNTIKPKNYYDSQIILNGDRITLNSKKDEVLLFAKTNIEITANNTINLNTGRIIHLNAPMIKIGTLKNGNYPTEPAVLGQQLVLFLNSLLNALSKLSGGLASSTLPAEVGGTPISSLKFAGANLHSDIDRLQKIINQINSTKVFIA